MFLNLIILLFQICTFILWIFIQQGKRLFQYLMQGSDHLFRSDRSHPVWWSGQCRAVQCSAVQCSAVQCRAHHINEKRKLLRTCGSCSDNICHPGLLSLQLPQVQGGHPQHLLPLQLWGAQHQQPHYMCCSVVNKYDVQVDMPHGRGAVQVPRVAGEAGRYDAHQALHGAAQGRHRSVADCGHKVVSDIMSTI